MNSDAEEIIREYIDGVDKSLDELPDGGVLTVDWFVFPILESKYMNITKHLEDNRIVLDYKGRTITILKSNSIYSPLLEAIRMLVVDSGSGEETRKYVVTLSITVDAKDENDALDKFYREIVYMYENGLNEFLGDIVVREVGDSE